MRWRAGPPTPPARCWSTWTSRARCWWPPAAGWPPAPLVVTVPGGPMSAFDHHIGHRRHYDIPDLTALLEGRGSPWASAAGPGSRRSTCIAE